MSRKWKSVASFFVVTALLLVVAPFESQLTAGGYIPKSIYVTADQSKTPSFGEGTSCDAPDAVVDTSVNSSEITSLFDDHVLSGDAVVFCPGTYYISETIEISNKEVFIIGIATATSDFTGDVILDGKGTTQIIRVVGTGSLGLAGLVLQNGYAPNQSIVNDCVTESGCGGAIGIMTSGTVFINFALFRGNHSASIGGAIAINGGQGLWDTTDDGVTNPTQNTCLTVVELCKNATVTISASHFEGNSAMDGGAIGSTVHNLAQDPNKTEIGSNTFYDNTASRAGDAAAAVFSWMQITNNTIVEPTWSNSGAVSGSVRLVNNIIAVQEAAPEGTPTGVLCGGAVSDGGGNIANDATCDFSNELRLTQGDSFVVGDYEVLDLSPLSTFETHGTPMFAPLQFSPAIGAGLEYSSCFDSDQRGVNRLPAIDGETNCESGAFERMMPNEPFITYTTGGGPSGIGMTGNPFVVPVGMEMQINHDYPIMAGLYDPFLDDIELFSFPYANWSIGDRTLMLQADFGGGDFEPFIYEMEFELPYTAWPDCQIGFDFCIESATLSHDGNDYSLRNTNDFNLEFNANFLDGGNGVMSFNWGLGAWGSGFQSHIDALHEDDTVTAVLRTGGFVPRMTTSFSKDLTVSVSETAGVNRITITGKPTEVNWLEAAHSLYTSCTQTGVCGDDTTKASAPLTIFNGNTQDLHTFGDEADKFSGFYSAQNAQFGPAVQLLALMFYPDEEYWELLLANPHLSSTDQVNTGSMNSWVPASYFESLGTTLTAAAAVGFTVESEETTDDGPVTRVVPAEISIVNNGLMVSVDNLSYSTNRIRVRNEPDPGIRVMASSVAGGEYRNDPNMTYSFRMDRVVSGASVDDFEFDTSTTATGCSINSVSINDLDVLVEVTGCSDSGEVVLKMKANSMQFGSDTGPDTAYTASLVTIDSVAPSATSFTTSEPSVTKSAEITYSLQFSEAVEGIDGDDFVNTGNAINCEFEPSGSSGTTITVTVTGCSNSGTLRPQLVTTNITDLAGNSPVAEVITASGTIKIDRVPPQLRFKTVTAKKTKLRTLTFSVRATNLKESLRCSTITKDDFVITKGKFISSTSKKGKCLVKIRSTIKASGRGTTQVAKSGRLQISDMAGNIQSSVSGLSLKWTILKGVG